MSNFKKQILGVLNEIKGGGSFVSSDIKPFLFPGLEIQGIDEIGFPINPLQIKEIIKVAHKAPFGKGSQTVLDSTVRSAWEIDADKISFKNKDWEVFIANIVEQIKPNLGIETHAVAANLYKMLIYEEGDFFLAHKDSEKEKGMFGTLIVGLPSMHTGGELVIQFDGKTEVIDFSQPAAAYKIPFVAFYADCQHEIKPITSGFRVCLVYNLAQTKGKEKIQLYQLGSYVEKLSVILRTEEEKKEEQNILKTILLGHQYTPSNFTMEALKLNDRPKAEALILAAQKAGFYAKLGLVTSYQSGALEEDYKQRSSKYNRSRSYYDDDEYDNDDELAKNGTMGEIYDEYIEIEHWMQDGIPPLRNIQLKEKDLIAAITLNEDEPIEKEAEG
jgi:predicted 2-oxoglutarate/Fe(II)-dependent dioxygenase YbiX